MMDLEHGNRALSALITLSYNLDHPNIFIEELRLSKLLLSRMIMSAIEMMYNAVL